MIKTHTTGNMSENAEGTVGSMYWTSYGATGSISVLGTGETDGKDGTARSRQARFKINVEHTHTYGNATDNYETRPENFTVIIWYRMA